MFSLYGEQIIRSVEEIPDVAVGDQNINKVRYADVTALIARSQKELQQIIDSRVVESKNNWVSD